MIGVAGHQALARPGDGRHSRSIRDNQLRQAAQGRRLAGRGAFAGLGLGQQAGHGHFGADLPAQLVLQFGAMTRQPDEEVGFRAAGEVAQDALFANRLDQGQISRVVPARSGLVEG